MARKASSADLRRAGLDLCDAVVADLCGRGLLTVTREVLDRVAEHERSLQSYKLTRFSRELAALRFRLGTALKKGSVTAEVIGGRLARLHVASVNLRRLLEDPTANPLEIEDLAGKTWRDPDLDRRENVLLAELAWDSVRLEEGFRVDTSYFLARGGAVWCERKIVPLQILAAIDDSLKPQHPDPRVYGAIGLYPGDLPRRVKILQRDVPDAPRARPSPRELQELISGAAESVGEIRHQFLARRQRPFPPDGLPVIIARPRLYYAAGEWEIVGSDGLALKAVPAPGLDRQPPGRYSFEVFETTVLSHPIDALLLLLHDCGAMLAAAPLGALTPDGVVRFGLS